LKARNDAAKILRLPPNRDGLPELSIGVTNLVCSGSYLHATDEDHTTRLSSALVEIIGQVRDKKAASERYD
jgi:hypothetical protein